MNLIIQDRDVTHTPRVWFAWTGFALYYHFSAFNSRLIGRSTVIMPQLTQDIIHADWVCSMLKCILSILIHPCVMRDSTATKCRLWIISLWRFVLPRPRNKTRGFFSFSSYTALQRQWSKFMYVYSYVFDVIKFRLASMHYMYAMHIN